MQEPVESNIKVAIKPCGTAAGIDADNDQLLREASWEYNALRVDVAAEFRRTNIRLLGGRWIESVL